MLIFSFRSLVFFSLVFATLLEIVNPASAFVDPPSSFAQISFKTRIAALSPGTTLAFKWSDAEKAASERYFIDGLIEAKNEIVSEKLGTIFSHIVPRASWQGETIPLRYMYVRRYTSISTIIRTSTESMPSSLVVQSVSPIEIDGYYKGVRIEGFSEKGLAEIILNVSADREPTIGDLFGSIGYRLISIGDFKLTKGQRTASWCRNALRVPFAMGRI